MRRICLSATFCLLFLSVFAQTASEVIQSIPFRNIGPAFMTGRIADIEKDPVNPSTWYVAVASGNVWKTTNNGTTWQPIFERYGSFSTGCLAIDPNNPNVIWLGTGENQSQRSVSWGDGIYKSIDGGKSWVNVGLKKSEHIGKILIDPRNSDIVYVAAQGPLWAPGGERGVYKTMDGGKSWEQVLSISENTGVADLSFDPSNPDILYAASYQRRRHVGILVAGGPESRIYKSTNAGSDWKMLKKGLPQGELGRIAIAVSPQKSNVVYALIAGSNAQQSGFYRSEDYGESWTKKNDYVIVDPQYYGEIFVDPNRFDHVYAVDVIIRYTEDGGSSFKRLNTRFKHVDNHEILFDPKDPDYLMVGCDGGIYESWDKGNKWTYHSNLPITQFYRVGLDNDKPFYNIYGGTQDNATISGPSRTLNRHGITNMDWKVILGGDGFQARIDPEDPNIVYCESQYAGIVRYDRRTGQRIGIQPQPQPEEDALRWHWDAPLIISPHNPKRLYFAAQRLFRSDDRGDTWRPVSDDLSRGEDRNQRAVMGKVWSPEAVWKNVFTSPYGTIVSLSESKLKEDLIVVGTDDGHIQVTQNGGQSWTKYDQFPGVPERSYVADVFTSQHNEQVIYAVFNNHKEGDFKPYVLKSNNLGRSWTSINKGIDAPHACWSIVEDHMNPNLLFAATEYGIFCSIDGGAAWTQMKGKLPTIAFRDLEIQQRENDLVGASFGRGMFVLDNYSALRELATMDASKAHLFSVKDSWQYFERGDLGYSRKGSLGDNFYSADNPDYGTTFSLYLPQKWSGKKAARKAQQNNTYPSAADLKMEDFEQAVKLFVRISNNQKEVIASVPVQNRKGFQRVSWDLSTSVKSLDGSLSRSIAAVPDGTYKGQIFLLQNGALSAISDSQSFQVKTLDLSPEPIPSDRFAFYKNAAATLIQADLLNRNISQDLSMITKQMQQLVTSSDAANEIKDLENKRLELLELQYELIGDQTKKKRFQYFLPGVRDRLQRIYRSQYESRQITNTHRQNFELASSQLMGLQSKYRAIQ